MRRLTDTERIDRLERCFLSFTALLTGELARVTSPEELAAAQAFLAKEMREMTEEQNGCGN